jgi:hypothetical protein
MKKRIMAILLTVAMLLSVCSFTAMATDETTSGTCGDNLTWTLEDGVLTISGTGEMQDDWTFSDEWREIRDNVTSVVIEKGVTSISDWAFDGYKGLTKVTLPEGLAQIGDDAFGGCTSLKTILLPEGLTAISDGLFYGCSSLTTVYIPDSVTSIAHSAFELCTSLTTITIPDSVTEIGAYAFYECTSLKTITIPESVESIWQYAFAGCENLTNVTISEGVQKISWAAFSGCPKLYSVTIPQSVTEIGPSAFGIYQDDDYNTFTVEGFTIYGVAGSAAGTYATEKGFNFSALEENPATSGTFSGTDSNGESWVTTWVLSEDGTLTISGKGSDACVPMYAFQNRTDIKKVVIEGTVATTGTCSFEGCTNLVSVKLCEGFQILGIGSLYGCTRLEAIEIPADIWAIEGNNFSLTVLTDVYYTGTEADWKTVRADEDRFFSTNNNGPLYEANWHFSSSLPDNYCTDGHTLDSTTYTVITESTATEYGLVQLLCSVCGVTKEEVVAESGHAWDSGEVTKAATDTEKGVKTYTCANCGETKMEEIDYQSIPGDINGDDKVDTNDLVRLMKKISENAQDTYLDINNDGKVDTNDLIRLMKYLTDPAVKIY